MSGRLEDIFGTDDEDDEDEEDNENDEDDAEHNDNHGRQDSSDDDDGWRVPVALTDDSPQDVMDFEDAVVVDGHTNEEQVNYIQPRHPFVGTIWNGDAPQLTVPYALAAKLAAVAGPKVSRSSCSAT